LTASALTTQILVQIEAATLSCFTFHPNAELSYPVLVLHSAWGVEGCKQAGVHWNEQASPDQHTRGAEMQQRQTSQGRTGQR